MQGQDSEAPPAAQVTAAPDGGGRPLGAPIATAVSTATGHTKPPPACLGLPLSRGDTAAVILLTACADVCLYRTPGGPGAACLLVLSLAVLLGVRREATTRADWTLGVLAVLAAAMMVWRHWWLLHLVGWVSLFLLAAKRRRPDWRLPEALWATAKTLTQSPLRLLGHFLARHRREPLEGGDAATPRARTTAVHVVLIPLGVCLVFLLIFMAANPVLAKAVRAVFSRIGNWLEHIGEYVTLGRASLWILWLMLFAALIRPAAKSLLADWLAGRDEALQPPEEGVPDPGRFAAALWTLASVNVLFLAYNAMDAVYLYFKATLPEGITWTDYTHAGCGWLTLALFLSTVVTGVVFWRELNFHPRVRSLRLLSYLWAAQNGLLAVGAIRRLQMYVDYSGLTHLRITGIYGSLLVTSGVAIMVYKVYARRSFVWLVRKDVLAFCLALALLALTPNDWLCATYNTRQIMAGKPRALRPVCLKTLTAEALPPLVALLDYKRADHDAARETIVREGMAALLGEHLARLEAAESRPWSQWQGADTWVLRRLKPVRARLAAMVAPDQWPAARRRLVENYDLAQMSP